MPPNQKKKGYALILFKTMQSVSYMTIQLPCQNGCKNDLIVLQQHQMPNKNHSDPETSKPRSFESFRNSSLSRANSRYRSRIT